MDDFVKNEKIENNPLKAILVKGKNEHSNKEKKNLRRGESNPAPMDENHVS